MMLQQLLFLWSSVCSCEYILNKDYKRKFKKQRICHMLHKNNFLTRKHFLFTSTDQDGWTTDHQQDESWYCSTLTPIELWFPRETLGFDIEPESILKFQFARHVL